MPPTTRRGPTSMEFMKMDAEEDPDEKIEQVAI